MQTIQEKHRGDKQPQPKGKKIVAARGEWRLRAAKFSPPSLSRPPHVLACHCHEAAPASSEREIAHHLVALFCSCLKSAENQPIISRHDPPPAEAAFTCKVRAEKNSHTFDFSAWLWGKEGKKEESSPNENLLADGIAVWCRWFHSLHPIIEINTWTTMPVAVLPHRRQVWLGREFKSTTRV